jgi:hypothetical protein
MYLFLVDIYHEYDYTATNALVMLIFNNLLSLHAMTL